MLEVSGAREYKAFDIDSIVGAYKVLLAQFCGSPHEVLLLDVTPLTLGIETEGGVLTPIVERNTTIPVEKTQVFSTAADNQPAVTVKVFQGERKMAANNKVLGEFNLEGIPPAPRGVPQIEVKFDIDQNGILNVSAKDLGTQKEASVRIEDSAGLDDSEIERMRQDAEDHAEEDKKQFELVEARNKADQLVYQMEKLIEENAEKLSEDDLAPVKASVDKVKESAKGEDKDVINSAVADLEQTSQALSQVLYQASQTDPGSDESSEDVKDDDAIDAEFEVKSDEEADTE